MLIMVFFYISILKYSKQSKNACIQHYLYVFYQELYNVFFEVNFPSLNPPEEPVNEYV